jgi:hypothetical protein
MAAPKGNRNAAKGHMWAGAIRRALAEDREALQEIARKLVSKAKEGDLAYIKEIGDRLDGKAAQSLELSGGFEMLKSANELTDDDLAHIATGSSPGVATEAEGTGTLN